MIIRFKIDRLEIGDATYHNVILQHPDELVEFGIRDAAERLAKYNAEVLKYKKAVWTTDIEQRFNDRLQELTGNPTVWEKEGWLSKREAAKKHRARTLGTSGELYDLFNGEALGRGITKDALATLVETKSKAYHKVYGKLAGIYKGFLEGIDSKTTIDAAETFYNSKKNLIEAVR